MKKYIKKPAVWLVAAAIVGGGLTPVWAENGTMSKLLASNIPSDVAGLTNVKQVTNTEGNYIKANVREDITKVIVMLPDNGKIEIASFPNQSLTVAIPPSASKEGKTATLLAYVNTELVDMAKVKLADGTVANDELVYAHAVLDQAAGKLKVTGIVNPKVDKVVVRYGGDSNEATLDHVWEGAKSFAYSISASTAEEANVIVELYKGGKQISEQKVTINKVNVPDIIVKPTGTIKGTAQLSAKNKKVEVKGSITYKNGDKKGDWKLIATAPDGKKHEIKVGANGSFEAKLPFKNRSMSAKSVHFELFYDKTLVAKADIAHGTPVNKEAAQKEQAIKVVHFDQEELEKNKEKLKEYWKQNAKNNWEKHEKKEKGHKDSDDDHDKDDDHDHDKDED